MVHQDDFQYQLGVPQQAVTPMVSKEPGKWMKINKRIKNEKFQKHEATEVCKLNESELIVKPTNVMVLLAYYGKQEPVAIMFTSTTQFQKPSRINARVAELP